MAEEKVTIKYETDYDGKGAKTAAADAQKVADTAKRAGDAAKERARKVKQVSPLWPPEPPR